MDAVPHKTIRILENHDIIIIYIFGASKLTHPLDSFASIDILCSNVPGLRRLPPFYQDPLQETRVEP